MAGTTDESAAAKRTSTPKAAAKVKKKASKKAKSKTSKKGGTKVERKEFMFVQHADDRRRVPGTSVYLDDLDRERAEKDRARMEGREPDFKNASSTQSTPVGTLEYVRSQGITNADVKPEFELEVSVAEPEPGKNEPSPYDRVSMTVDQKVAQEGDTSPQTTWQQEKLPADHPDPNR